jgi:hypothetical protein
MVLPYTIGNHGYGPTNRKWVTIGGYTVKEPDKPEPWQSLVAMDTVWMLQVTPGEIRVISGDIGLERFRDMA